MINCYFVSDLHGKKKKYLRLFSKIYQENPDVVFLGGDILPGNKLSSENFILDFLFLELKKLQHKMKLRYPKIFIILGNDDPRTNEKDILEVQKAKLWSYANERIYNFQNHQIVGYSYVPPSPFLLKDWEKFDVSRHVDLGAVSPLAGYRSVPKNVVQIEYETIARDLKKLSENLEMRNAVFLFHAPPYQTNLDRAALDGKMIDHAPLDVHVGSIAIKNFIQTEQPKLTLHGHIHESSQITGNWQEKIKRTFCFTAAYDSPKLAIVKFELNDLSSAERILL